MYEIVEGVHKALRIESSWVFILIMAVGAGLVGGFFGWVIDTGYRNSAEYKADHPSPKSQTVVEKNETASPMVQDAPSQTASIQPPATSTVIPRAKSKIKSPALQYDAVMDDVKMKGFGTGIETDAGGKFSINNSHIDGNGVGIQNNSPQADFSLNKSSVDGNRVGIANSPGTNQGHPAASDCIPNQPCHITIVNSTFTPAAPEIPSSQPPVALSIHGQDVNVMDNYFGSGKVEVDAPKVSFSGNRIELQPWLAYMGTMKRNIPADSINAAIGAYHRILSDKWRDLPSGERDGYMNELAKIEADFEALASKTDERQNLAQKLEQRPPDFVDITPPSQP
jgi:hypothetical protein